MGRLILRTLVAALGLWIAHGLLPGFALHAPSSDSDATLSQLLAFLFLGLISVAVNALIKPIATLISLPINILTLGLFSIVINATMLWVTAWLSSLTPVRLTIDTFFWTAILAALIVSAVSLLSNALIRKTA